MDQRSAIWNFEKNVSLQYHKLNQHSWERKVLPKLQETRALTLIAILSHVLRWEVSDLRLFTFNGRTCVRINSYCKRQEIYLTRSPRCLISMVGGGLQCPLACCRSGEYGGKSLVWLATDLKSIKFQPWRWRDWERGYERVEKWNATFKSWLEREVSPEKRGLGMSSTSRHC